MRRSQRYRSFVALLLVAATVVCVSGLFAAATGAAIRIASPADGSRVSGVVEVQASVTTPDRVSYVIFGVDDTRPGSTNSPPYVYQLDTTALADGKHRVFCEAYDSYGMVAASKPITIEVRNGSAPAVEVRGAAREVAAKVGPGPAGSVTAKAPAVVARGPRPEPAAAKDALTVAQAPTDAAARERRLRGHTVVLNGRVVDFDVAPMIRDARIQVGFRAMFEEMGARVTWMPTERLARSINGTQVVEVTAGSRIAAVNGEEMDLGMPSFIQDSRLMVPLRFVGDATGSYVAWDPQTRVASLQTRSQEIAQRTVGEE